MSRTLISVFFARPKICFSRTAAGAADVGDACGGFGGMRRSYEVVEGSVDRYRS
jgi:hypothetical protein